VSITLGVEQIISPSPHAFIRPLHKSNGFPCDYDVLEPKALPTMKLTLHKAPLFIATLMMLSSAGADANETAESSTGTAPGVVVKVEKAIERGAKATASGVKRGARAAARGIEHGAKAAASGVERGAKATGNAAHAVARKAGGSPTPSSSPGK
jgi:hypothetical protein